MANRYPYTLNELMNSIKRRGAIPEAQMTFMPEDFQAMANEELLTYVLPTLVKLRQDYYMAETSFDPKKPDKTIGGFPAFRLPYRATASTIRDVHGVGPNGQLYPIGKTKLDDIPNMVGYAWYLYGEYLVLAYTTPYISWMPQSIRVVYEARPNKLVYEESGMVVVNKNSDTELQLYAGDPNLGTITGTDNYCFISGKPGFNTVLEGLVPVSDIVFNFVGYPPSCTATLSAERAAQISVGDWLCNDGESTIPQIPVEMHPLLAQRVVVKFLEAQGEQEQLQAAVNILQGMEERIPILMQPRVEGKPTKLAPRIGLWRRWRW